VNIGDILRDSWRITTHCWQLWLLMLAVFVAFIPTLILTGIISGASTFLSQDIPDFQFDIQSRLHSLSFQEWFSILSVALLLVMISAAVSWIFQTAAMRASIMAADNSPISLKSALGLGQRRFIYIIKLSAVFGLLLAFLGLFPVLPDLFLRGSPAGTLLRGVTQIGMLPVNTILGLVVLLVLMSVALEEVTPAKSFRRAWKVFKSGWWGFLFVMAATLALSILPVIVLVPLLLIAIFALIVELGWVLLLAAALILVPLSLVISLFSAVFTLVMYTLIYRSSAELLDSSSEQFILQHR
jgi:hypothetical protein